MSGKQGIQSGEDIAKGHVEKTLSGEYDTQKAMEVSMGEPVLARAKRDDKFSPLGFYMPEELGEAYAESSWTQRERTRILIEISKGYEKDPRIALAAIALLEKYNWAVVTASGQIQDLRISRTSEKDGVVTKEDAKVMRIGGLKCDDLDIIDVDEKEEKNEQQKSIERSDEKPRDDKVEKPRDQWHKPPKNAFSQGLFREET